MNSGQAGISIRVDGFDQVGEARRKASAFAAAAGFDQTDASRAALVATECATNVVKHGGGGEILLQNGEQGAVEIMALDKGRGMPNVERCFDDGYSTSGSPGTGLGAVARLSSEWDVYSSPGHGTAMLSRIRARGSAAPPLRKLRAGAVCIPKPGETESGDGWAFEAHRDFAAAMVVDGLGHGPDAAGCARAAILAFEKAWQNVPAEVIQALHTALRPTRGAAAAVVRLDFESRQVLYAGIGNIGAVIAGQQKPHHLVSGAGILGGSFRSVREFTYDWPPNSTLLIYSDGINSRWSFDAYEGLALKDPSLAAAVIYRDSSRGRDDATVLVISEKHAK